MRIFLACTNSIKDKAKIKESKYILESYFSGERNCLNILKECGVNNFLLDSGAFTFMNNYKGIVNWQEYIDKYADFIIKNNIKYFFELDIDVLVGYEKVKEYRRYLENKTQRQCIPVWHKSRGLEEWKKMVKEYDYIAIGGLVIKEIKNKEYSLIKKMVDYAYMRGVKVHGLGFTKTKILEKEKWRFYSVDSSSWLSSAARGQKLQIFKNGYITNVDMEKRKVKANINKMAEFNFLEWCKYQEYADKYL